MAYGARLESVLGASPRGFESPILRHRTPGPVEVPGFLLPLASLVLLVVPLVFRAPSGPATVCAAGRRPAREPSAPRASLGASSRSPARPRRPRCGLQSGGAWGACALWLCRARAPQPSPPIPPAPSTPAALCRCAWLARSPLPPSNFARNSPETISEFELYSLVFQRF